MVNEKRILPGKSFPLGSTPDSLGTNFALFTQNANKVELCLFDQDGKETVRVQLTNRDNNIFHIYLEGVFPGQLYGYRVYGPYSPNDGKRFNANKLLLDPYAKAICGALEWHESIFAYDIKSSDSDISFSELDSAQYVPKSVVIDPYFDWENDTAPQIPFADTIIYELHVKGFSKLNTEIPEALRGTYLGLSHPSSISYLKTLGITAVELMPVHQFISDGHLIEKGLSNYWGYNTIGFFAPHGEYSSSGENGEQVNEFKNMVKTLHQSGIEVILDVVYNHTAEGNELGPTISMKGIDNESYYRLSKGNKRYYDDYTGTGNTLNTYHPEVIRFIMDSLRYWITEMHVDGFRFDLASTLARGLHEVDMLGTFFEIIHQDPVISQVKLIAEPWDVGEGGYQVGKFPSGWAEWNGKYRDNVRKFWKGEANMWMEFNQRILGSPDLYMKDYRRPTASINFLTAHDGFTLSDLVSYREKHNEANKDDNTDGEDENNSWNCGQEGHADDAAIVELRNKYRKSLMATLLVSQGIPMIVSGDEQGKTQDGNNNAYCQDNEISWINWDKLDSEQLKFTADLIALRQMHPSLRRREWINREKVNADGLPDIAWFSPNAKFLNGQDPNEPDDTAFGVFIHGQGFQGQDLNGLEIKDVHFLVFFNCSFKPTRFTLPDGQFSERWELCLSTQTLLEPQTIYDAGEGLVLESPSVTVFRSAGRLNGKPAAAPDYG